MAKSDSKRTQSSKTYSIGPGPRVGIFGAAGRMGQEITELWKQAFKGPVFLGVGEGKKEQAYVWVSDLKDSKCAEVDVWVDFSSPAGLSKILSYCLEHQKPLVSGTTGLEKEQMAEMKKASKKIPVLWSPNMSLGVNILLKSLQALRSVTGFDFQIEEIHHRHKKDNPSGTALWIHRELQALTKKKVAVPVGLRGGGVFGVHKVWALSDEEVLLFEHQALNRRVFAKGAIEAAIWLANKGAGMYSIGDVIGGDR
jgi:4-hydroxy-tetrahydrodipicolinate reductase